MKIQNLFLPVLIVCFLAADVVVGDLIGGSGNFDNTQILDNTEGVFSTISIAEQGSIQDISITIEGIQHTSVGDLIAQIRFLGDNPGGDTPADTPFLFFRPNFKPGFLGSRSDLDGDYTFTSDPNDARFWTEAGIPDDEVIDSDLDYFASDANGDFLDLAGPEFFQGFNTQGDWQIFIFDAEEFGNNEGSVQSWSIQFHVNPIPEPSSLAAIITAGAFCLRRKR